MAFEPFINNAGDEKDKKNGRRLRIHALYSNSIAASGMWFFTSIRAIWLKSNLYLGYRIDDLITPNYWSGSVLHVSEIDWIACPCFPDAPLEIVSIIQTYRP